jgi:hypothetical protein
VARGSHGARADGDVAIPLRVARGGAARPGVPGCWPYGTAGGGGGARWPKGHTRSSLQSRPQLSRDSSLCLFARFRSRILFIVFHFNSRFLDVGCTRPLPPPFSLVLSGSRTGRPWPPPTTSVPRLNPGPCARRPSRDIAACARVCSCRGRQ